MASSTIEKVYKNDTYIPPEVILDDDGGCGKTSSAIASFAEYLQDIDIEANLMASSVCFTDKSHAPGTYRLSAHAMRNDELRLIILRMSPSAWSNETYIQFADVDKFIDLLRAFQRRVLAEHTQYANYDDNCRILTIKLDTTPESLYDARGFIGASIDPKFEAFATKYNADAPYGTTATVLLDVIDEACEAAGYKRRNSCNPRAVNIFRSTASNNVWACDGEAEISFSFCVKSKEDRLKIFNIIKPIVVDYQRYKKVNITFIEEQLDGTKVETPAADEFLSVYVA